MPLLQPFYLIVTDKDNGTFRRGPNDRRQTMESCHRCRPEIRATGQVFLAKRVICRRCG